ncbi:MAG: hypothetical protein SCH71_12665 [Desulfobulbaceae bacterium]|nr:hypothetical protein [Desulfobulbaceae bacterium]
MITMPLLFREGHVYLETGRELWLFDTGSPASFGASGTITLANETFRVGSSYLGLTAATLSGFVGVDCIGLLGADVLGQFDFILDVPNGKVVISTSDLEHNGTTISLGAFMGIPIVTGQIRGRDCRMFFDTGASISYIQNDEMRTSFPASGRVSDFYPGFGQFETDTHSVDIILGTLELTLRCGELPGVLGEVLAMADTEGILGNQILSGQAAGYFPRRRLLVL